MRNDSKVLPVLVLLAAMSSAANGQWTRDPSTAITPTTNTDRVGVGSASYPGAQLQVSGIYGSPIFKIVGNPGANPGNLWIRDTICCLGYSGGIVMTLEGNSQIQFPFMYIGSFGNPVIQSTSGVALALNTDAGGGDVIVGNTATSGRLVVQSHGISSFAGDLNIGTSAQHANLNVTGVVQSPVVQFGDGSTQTTAFRPSSGLLRLNNAALPSYTLESSSGQSSAFSTGTGTYIDVYGASTAANNFIAFRTSSAANSSTLVEAMRVTSSGKLEIGTALAPAPAVERLTVNGGATFSGTLTANSVVNAVYGQDVAEWVRGDRELAAGTVVIVNPEKNNEVMPSTTAYDTTVAGVVSAQPGVILGRPGELKATVATSGRVRVRVDARKGAIRVGDLLVTSDEPGTAMKSQPIDVGGRKFHQPGTILGKALEPLPEGAGEILVLLCLG